MPKLLHDFSPMLKTYDDGSIDRLLGTDKVPPSLDPDSPVLSKDVVYYPEPDLSCRLYLPKGTKDGQKLPLLVYFHGGGFCIETAFSPTYHNYLNQLVPDANAIGVSVDYRLAPEHPLPTAFDDCWTALNWVASHVNGDGPESWLNSHADFGRIFFAGDSAGGTLAQQMGIRLGQEKSPGLNIMGIILVHPYFWAHELVGNELIKTAELKLPEALWIFAHPKSRGFDDPLINPVIDPKLSSLGCKKVLVIVAGKDILGERGWHYYEKLKGCRWNGEVEIMEAEEESHVFHLFKPDSDNSVAMLRRISSFINQVIHV